ncbi:MAG: hypothetical protein ACXWT3_02885 [Methylococcaceae bacterium]
MLIDRRKRNLRPNFNQWLAVLFHCMLIRIDQVKKQDTAKIFAVTKDGAESVSKVSTIYTPK